MQDDRGGPPTRTVAGSIVVSGACLVLALLLAWNNLTTPGPGEVCDEPVSAGCQPWNSLTMLAAVAVAVPPWLIASAVAFVGRRRWSPTAAWVATFAPPLVVTAVAVWLAVGLPV